MVSEDLKEILEIIPTRELKSLAKKYNISTTGNRQDLIDRLVAVIEDEDILDVWDQYQDAGDVTIHFAIIDENIFDEFKDDPEKYIRDVGLDKYYKKKIETSDLTTAPTLQKISIRNNSYYFHFIYRGKITEFYLAEKIEGIKRIQDGYIQGSATLIIETDHRLIQIRCRQRALVKNIINTFKNWFPDSKLVSFTKENAKFWINSENSKLSNIRFKLLGENLSSVSFTAPKSGDLKQEEALIEENWEKGFCSGFYISADVEINDNSHKLGLLFNIKQGKIYFKTYSSESEIKFVIERLIECLGL